MKLVLIGFMGSGKTTVSKLLAKKMKFKHIEMDDEIVKQSSYRSVIEIFEKEGEQHFRKLETQIAQELQETNNIIISSGGGVVTVPKTMQHLKNNATCIFLSTSFDEILERLKDDDTRPLFLNKNLAKDRYENRKLLYTKYADIIVRTDNKTPQQIVREIMTHI